MKSDRERQFRLPNVQELTKEQERARLLPMEGCHLVVGGPGTGKSVVALLRARRYQREQGNNYVFLAYNVLLIKASSELMSGEVNAQTWIKWFKQTYMATMNAPCPIKDGKPWSIDWAPVNKEIQQQEVPSASRQPFLVIDEGQDMPEQFYQALAEIGFENFFVVADQHQTITEENCKIPQIADSIDIDIQDIVPLTLNHRNNYPVARLAHEFCTNDPSSPCPELPPIGRSSRTPVLLNYGPGCRWDFDDLVSRLLVKSDKEPRRLFGLITPDNTTRLRWLRALQTCNIRLDCERQIITYASGEDQRQLSFTMGGIIVLNAQSVKGLEFDNVIIADINNFYCHANDLDAIRRRFYVMVSRAKERVTILRQAGRPCPVNAILPSEPDVLEEWDAHE